jgi:hypothetical protein
MEFFPYKEFSFSFSLNISGIRRNLNTIRQTIVEDMFAKLNYLNYLHFT